MPSSTDYGTLAAGYLTSRLASGATSGARVTVIEVNGSAITWPTGAHRIQVRRKTANGLAFETIGVASASQSGSTVTLGTLTRQMSLTDGSTFSTGGNGYTFPANSEVYVSWDVFDAEQTAKKDIANTFSAKQTFSVPKGGAVYATFGDLPAGGNGDEGAYVTADGQFYDYIAGSWQARASGTNPNGSTTVAGKFEEATVSEQGTATATGATGARLVPAVANLVKTSSGSGDENKIAVLNSAGKFNIGFIASGTPDGTKFVRDDGTLQTPSSIHYDKTVYCSGTSSTLLSNPTAATVFDTHTYTIPANDLVNGVEYEIDATVTVVNGTNTTAVFDIQLGGAVKVSTTSTTLTSGTFQTHLRGRITGTTTAGASSSVKFALSTTKGDAGGVSDSDYAAANCATNGTLAIQLSVLFGTSNGSNSATMTRCRITRHSSTAS